MKNQKPRFNREVIREMLGLANEEFEEIVKIAHFHPYAYCIAKPSVWCAVFAIPPQDNEPQVSDVKEILIQDSCVENVKSGDWCELAYICTKDGNGFNYVLKNNSQENGE